MSPRTAAVRWHRSRPGTILLGLVLPVALCLSWQAAANAGLVDASLWASPATVAQAVAAQLADPQFRSDWAVSLTRYAEGTSTGIAIGLAAGLALGRSSLVRDLFALPLDAAKAVPIFTWIPLLSVWVGSGDPGKVTFIALVAAMPVLFNTIEGVLSLEPRHLELIRLYHLGRLARLTRVVLPGAAPSILSGVHQAVLYGWLATIGAEQLFEAGNGIGINITGFRQLYELNFVIADMLAIGLVGIVLDIGFRRIEFFLLRWREDRPV